LHAAAVRYDLRIEGCRSLKDKRRVIKPLLEGLRRRFNVSATEVDFHDLVGRATIGVGVVSAEPFQISKTQRQIERFIMSYPEVEIIGSETSYMDRL
jgi:uncharacterized protein YlxP (DUF503 family)